MTTRRIYLDTLVADANGREIVGPRSKRVEVGDGKRDVVERTMALRVATWQQCHQKMATRRSQSHEPIRFALELLEAERFPVPVRCDVEVRSTENNVRKSGYR